MSCSAILFASTSTGIVAALFVDCALKGLLLLSFVALGLACRSGGSAAFRHLIWVSAPCGLLALPIFGWMLPSWNILPTWMNIDRIAASVATPQPVAPDADDGTGSAVGSSTTDTFVNRHDGGSANPPPLLVDVDDAENNHDRQSIGPSVERGADVQVVVPAESPLQADIATSMAEIAPVPRSRSTNWMIVVWMFGTSLLLIRLLASQWSLRRLARCCHRLIDGRLPEEVRQQAKHLGIRRPVDVYLSAERHIPMTWGLFRSHLLLPAGAIDWDDNRLRAVILHELAHVKRWDCHTQLLSHLACAFHWFNPLTWLAVRQIDLERERACDNIVLSSGVPATDYALHLVGIASGLPPHLLASYAAVAMARPRGLEGRLSLVLNEKINRRAVTRGVLFATLLVLTAIVLPIAMIRATANAEQHQPPSSGTADNDVGPADNDETTRQDDDDSWIDTLIPADIVWSEPIDDLRFRLHAPKTEFQSWELPTFIIEVHNLGDTEITAAQAETLFGELHVKKGLQFMFPKKAKRAPANANRWLVPTVRLDATKLIGLAADETIRLPVALIAKRESSTPKWGKYQLTTGPHTIGLGNFVFPEQPDYKTNTVTMHVLPPGVANRKQLNAFLKPYLADARSLKAGFVPHGTTLVWGQPLLVTFLVENLDDETFFEFSFGPGFSVGSAHPSFDIEITDSEGKPLPDLLIGHPSSGPGQWRVMGPRDSAVEVLDLAKYRGIPGPGEYTVRCQFHLRPSWADASQPKFNVPVQTTFKLNVLPRDPERVSSVLDELFRRSDRTAAGPLSKLIDSIALFGCDAAAAGLIQRAVEADLEHRVAAIDGLAQVTTAATLETLLNSAQNEPLPIRAAAVTALGRYTETGAVEAVVGVLSDPNQLLRTTAATALGAMKTEAAMNALLEELPTATEDVAVTILTALGASKSPRAFPALADTLEQDNQTLRLAAAWAMIEFPNQAETTLRKYSADADLDFREIVMRLLGEKLRKPIDAAKLMPVIRSRNPGYIGDAPRLLRLYARQLSVSTLLRCLDFTNPSVRTSYNSSVIENQMACRGLAVPWICNPNRDGTSDEIRQNARILRQLKAWVDRYEVEPQDPPLDPWRRSSKEEERSWGEAVKGVKLRAIANTRRWPEDLPQLLFVDALSDNGGSINFPKRPEVMEIELNGVVYFHDKSKEPTVFGDKGYFSGSRNFQLNDRWLRKSDQKVIDLKAGKYTVRVRISLPTSTGETVIVTSKPVQFEVLAVK